MPVDGSSVQYEGHSLARPDFVLCRRGAETDYFTLTVLRHFDRRGVRAAIAVGFTGTMGWQSFSIAAIGLLIAAPLGAYLARRRGYTAAARERLWLYRAEFAPAPSFRGF